MEHDSAGPSWVQKPSVSSFSFKEKNNQPPRPSLCSKEQIQSVTNQEREGMKKQRKSKQSRSDSSAIKQSQFLLKGYIYIYIYNNLMCIFEFFLQELKQTLTRVEDGNHMLSRSTRSTLGGTRKLINKILKHHTVTSPPTNERKAIPLQPSLQMLPSKALP